MASQNPEGIMLNAGVGASAFEPLGWCFKNIIPLSILVVAAGIALQELTSPEEVEVRSLSQDERAYLEDYRKRHP